MGFTTVFSMSYSGAAFYNSIIIALGRQGTSYSILPPILKYGKQDTPLQTTLNQKNANTQRKEPGFNGSYYDKHEKNKQQPQYKVTLSTMDSIIYYI